MNVEFQHKEFAENNDRHLDYKTYWDIRILFVIFFIVKAFIHLYLFEYEGMI